MRVKNIEVISSFVHGTNKGLTQSHTGNLYAVRQINGICDLYNYTTRIAHYNGNTFVVNMDKYSQTTSTIQNKLLNEIKQSNYNYTIVSHEELN